MVVWADVDHHDVLHVLWRSDSTCPMLSGGIQGLPLWPVVGLRNVWEVSIRITGLAAALVSVDVVIDDHVPAGSRVFRGELRGEVAIDDGTIAPVALLGIHSSEDRHLEYLPPEFWEQPTDSPDSEKRRAARAFERHVSFVLNDVFPWIHHELGHTDAARRFVQGNSNGAAWALAACQRHLESFAGAIGFQLRRFSSCGIPEREPSLRVCGGNPGTIS
jgi:Putative esterase